MSKSVPIDKPAPDFTLSDLNGQPVTLSQYQGEKNIVLIFNRGFL